MLSRITVLMFCIISRSERDPKEEPHAGHRFVFPLPGPLTGVATRGKATSTRKLGGHCTRTWPDKHTMVEGFSVRAFVSVPSSALLGIVLFFYGTCATRTPNGHEHVVRCGFRFWLLGPTAEGSFHKGKELHVLWRQSSGCAA